MRSPETARLSISLPSKEDFPAVVWKRSLLLSLGCLHASIFYLAIAVAGQLQNPVLAGLGVASDDGLTKEFVKAALLIATALLLGGGYLIVTYIARLVKIDLSIDWGFRRWRNHWPHLLAGLGLGFLGQLSIILYLQWNGYWQDGAAFGTLTLTAIAANFLTAIAEEIPFRAYLVQTSSKFMNIQLALFVSAIVFGIAHADTYSKHYGIPQAIAIIPAFMGGIMFAYAYRIRKNLWLPVGLHCAWDLFGGIFGAVLQSQTPPLMEMLISMGAVVIIMVVCVEWKLWQTRMSINLPSQSDKKS